MKDKVSNLLTYSSPNIIMAIKSRRMKWGRNLACMEEIRNACRILARKPDGRKPHGRYRYRY
jgi:hypothetical protein